jgi:hypothetical protein
MMTMSLHQFSKLWARLRPHYGYKRNESIPDGLDLAQQFDYLRVQAKKDAKKCKSVKVLFPIVLESIADLSRRVRSLELEQDERERTAARKERQNG